MSKYEGDDRHLYPGSEVLINKLNLHSQAKLDEAEAAIVLLATIEIGLNPIPEPADGPGFSYLLSIHNALFRDIYSWAGTIRDVDISKGGSRFANCRFIEQEGIRLGRELAAENWLAGRNAEQWAERMAFYMGEFNVLHPFREGNGRALREYVRYLAARAGHSLTWEGVTTDEMINAAIASFQGRTSELKGILIQQMKSVTEPEG
ncbi:Fic/DOC family protein [Paracoccus litorisediminis]|uniref:protein adenylyltransferase n=1 Tax=Paracoccus litorisediminis TaxID=2006130 RepID=A0A844HXJ6_9RHOB|nr:Fic family protein [Paracoccus litorisediminis]MTH62182.1 cell filamentation protein Fic [Paracoccus litorisediminis]